MSETEKQNIESELQKIQNESEKLRKKRIELLSKLGEKEIDADYNFIMKDGSKKSLAELFGTQKYLFRFIIWERDAPTAQCGQTDLMTRINT